MAQVNVASVGLSAKIINGLLKFSVHLIFADAAR